MEDNEYKKMIIHRIFSILKKINIYDIIINKLLKEPNPLYHNYITLYDLMVCILRYYKGVYDSQTEIKGYFFPFMYLLFNRQMIDMHEMMCDDFNNGSFWEDDILYNWYIEHVEKD
jgi:hypothetical protein